jgi:hypothetical protein
MSSSASGATSRRFMLGVLAAPRCSAPDTGADGTARFPWNDGPAEQAILDLVKTTTDRPNVARFRDKMKLRSLRGNAAFANPEGLRIAGGGRLRIHESGFPPIQCCRTASAAVGRPSCAAFTPASATKSGHGLSHAGRWRTWNGHSGELLTTRRVHRHQYDAPGRSTWIGGVE